MAVEPLHRITFAGGARQEVPRFRMHAVPHTSLGVPHLQRLQPQLCLVSPRQLSPATWCYWNYSRSRQDSVQAIVGIQYGMPSFCRDFIHSYFLVAICQLFEYQLSIAHARVIQDN